MSVHVIMFGFFRYICRNQNNQCTMETSRPDNVFPLTEEEILEQFDHVFNNQFLIPKVSFEITLKY